MRSGLVGALSAVALVGALLVSGSSANAARRHLPAGMVVLPVRHGSHRLVHGLVARRVGGDRARSAIVGGSRISIEHAPWQVAVLGEIPIVYQGKDAVLSELCSGAILDGTSVLTAAHCMFDPTTGERAPAEDFLVVAGSSDLATREATEQNVAVQSVRVHPYYSYDPEATQAGPDDVAVLKLKDPLALDSAVRAIPLVSPGSLAQEGEAVNLTGFGKQSVTPEELNGGLYSIGMTMGSSRDCGGEAGAVFVCASTAWGSLCEGDSGSALTIPGSPATLIGVVDTVEVIEGEPCRNGALGGFANVAAPEIQDFIDGSEAPPLAPRGGDGVMLTSPSVRPWVGESLTCSSGSWRGEPTYTYSFIDSVGGKVLQSGSSSVYQLTAADVGREILCQLQASNPGGTAVERTAALAPVQSAAAWSASGAAASAEQVAQAEAQKKAREEAERKALISTPLPEFTEPSSVGPDEIALDGARIHVKRNGTALVKLHCVGSEVCDVKLTLSVKVASGAKGGKRRSSSVMLGAGSYSIAAGHTSTVKLELDGRARRLLKADHGNLAARLRILELDTEATLFKGVSLIEQRS